MTDFAAELERLSLLLEEGLDTLRGEVIEFATAEATYREAKAKAWLEAPEGGRGQATVPEREAWVNARTAPQRFSRDLADGLRQAALETVRSRRTQISAYQSLMAGERAEAEFVRTGP